MELMCLLFPRGLRNGIFQRWLPGKMRRRHLTRFMRLFFCRIEKPFLYFLLERDWWGAHCFPSWRPTRSELARSSLFHCVLRDCPIAGKCFWTVKGLIRQAGMLLWRSEEQTSELQSLMRTSYAVFCLKQKKKLPQIKA